MFQQIPEKDLFSDDKDLKIEKNGSSFNIEVTNVSAHTNKLSKFVIRNRLDDAQLEVTVFLYTGK